MTKSNSTLDQNDYFYREIQKKGVDFFKPGLELFDLHKAYVVMIEYLMEEKYEQCDVIQSAIQGLLTREFKVLESSIDKLEKSWKKLYGHD